MIVLIDNYDSFSYNVYQLLGEIVPDIRVIRNDECTVKEIEHMAPEAIVLSPGPGRPEDAGICMDVVKQLGEKIPILGICLGHQAICKACGGEVSYAKELMHGKQSKVKKTEESRLFAGLPEIFPVARYHSLAAVEEKLPSCLKVTARTEDGEIMAVEHSTCPIYGVQFHPESVMTPDGKQMIENFVQAVRGAKKEEEA